MVDRIVSATAVELLDTGRAWVPVGVSANSIRGRCSAVERIGSNRRIAGRRPAAMLNITPAVACWWNS